MGKNKRQKLQSSGGKKPKPALAKTQGGRVSKPAPNTPKPKSHIQASQAEPTIPFLFNDQILLIGEGDLSFARSLVENHDCRNVTATVLESGKDELEEKYPHVGENIEVLEAAGAVVKYAVDATKMLPWTDKKGRGGVGIMDRIFFNFPHVGGKSTDVNRQVRYNQELLVAFFKAALPSLSPKSGSSIIVTLFEGEPYTLWNIRDLARHSGLQVEKSFKFQAKAYPGYKHARTLGVVKSKKGETGGGWKGEERPARSYIFVRKGDKGAPLLGTNKEEEKDDEGEEEADD
ncbi:hypothetical protein BP5796_04733 [Coleophoma crateriformis]|uniref:25S rRNA (uridine-N(3))-methyltransferase BMT5-like domain-containing protein n=1 Tax=Coleophoma crateriformis TaxID=565419 RepID=A0A3D8SA47_9HELO|nr:hypothetical protein BP5796_04733 [Coleophoma crateriformis]